MDVNETKIQVFTDLLDMKKKELGYAMETLNGTNNELAQAQVRYDRAKSIVDNLNNQIEVIEEVING